MIRNDLIRNTLVLRNHFLWPVTNFLHKDKEYLGLKYNFRVNKKFLITKFDCINGLFRFEKFDFYDQFSKVFSDLINDYFQICSLIRTCFFETWEYMDFNFWSLRFLNLSVDFYSSTWKLLSLKFQIHVIASRSFKDYIENWIYSIP